MGLTPILPVTVDWGTVEIPDFARITKSPAVPRPTRAGLAGNVVSATTEVEPRIRVPTGAKPTASAASMNGAYRFATRPFEFVMIVPSWGTVEPVNLLGWQTG
jgi:hypothetical protein